MRSKSRRNSSARQRARTRGSSTSPKGWSRCAASTASATPTSRPSWRSRRPASTTTSPPRPISAGAHRALPERSPRRSWRSTPRPTTAARQARRLREPLPEVLANERMCLCGMLAAEYETSRPDAGAVVGFLDDNEAWLARCSSKGTARAACASPTPAACTARSIVSGLEGAMLVAGPTAPSSASKQPPRNSSQASRAPDKTGRGWRKVLEISVAPDPEAA